MAHFYEPVTGEPRYEVEYAGKREGTRPATIRDAKKHGWYPSVTTILDVLDKPALTSWKVNQAIMATYGREKLDTETWPQFMRRCAAEADKVRDQAADDGSMLHDYIEKALEGNPIHPERWEETIQAAKGFLSETRPGEWTIERSFGRSGFGGRVDAYWSPETSGLPLEDDEGVGTEVSTLQPVVLDWKTKEFTSEDVTAGKVRGYNNHLWQLAGYQHGLGLRMGTIGINVFVSRTEPGLICPHYWEPSAMRRGWEQFKGILTVYQLLNGLELTYEISD